MYVFIMKAFGARQSAEHDRIMLLAWSTAALTRIKKMPELKSLLKADRPDPRLRQPKRWQDQYAAWASFISSKSKKKKK
jgi:hypothetical protein